MEELKNMFTESQGWGGGGVGEEDTTAEQQAFSALPHYLPHPPTPATPIFPSLRR